MLQFTILMYSTHVRHRYLLIEMKLSILVPLRRHSKEFLILVFTLTILLQQAQSLTNAEVTRYLNSHLNKDQLDMVAFNSSHKLLLKMYMNGMVDAPGLTNVTLKDVLQVTAEVEKTSLSYGSQCNMLVHHELVMTAQSHFYDFVQTVAGRTRKGIKYCNFLAYLQCLDDPTTGHAGHHSCSCLPQMAWSSRMATCVFRDGQVCARRHEVNGVKFYQFDWTITQSAEDFVTSKMPEHCEMGSYCSKQGVCMGNLDHKYLLPVTDILEYYLHDSVNDKQRGGKCIDCLDHSGKVAGMRQALSELSKPSSTVLLTISLEIQGTRHHLKHGQACTTTLEHHFRPIITENTAQHNPDWYSEEDRLRQKYLRELLAKDGKLCDPFSLLTCQLGKCSCGPNRIYHPKLRKCVLKTGSPCGPNLQTKEFRFHLRKSNQFSTGLSIYNWSPVECEKQDCAEVEHGVMFCTSEPLHNRYTLNQRFRIHLGEPCNETEEYSVFAARTNMDPAEAIDDLRAHVSRIMDQPQVQFCELTHHAMCLKNICSCIPPLIHQNNRCVAPLYVKCDSKEDFIQMEDALHELTQILVNSHKHDYIMEVFCARGLSCISVGPTDDLRFCSCVNGLHGDQCLTQPSSYVSFLGREEELPPSMLTEEGQKALDLAHVTLSSLEDHMTLKAGDTCNLEHYVKVEALLLFFRRIQQEGCGPSALCTPDQFNAIIEAGMHLLKHGPALCDRIKNVVCTNSICGCPPYTYEERDECHLELGFPCLELMGELNKGLAVRCRTGTICIEGYCQLAQTRFTQNWQPLEKGGETYVDEIYMLYVNFYRGRLTSVLQQRLTGPGGTCSQADEQMMTSFVEAVRPLLQQATEFSRQSLSEKLQIVRLLQSLENNDVTLVHNFGPLCNPSTICDSDGRCVSLLERDLKVTTEGSSVSLTPLHYLAQLLLAHLLFCIL